MRKLMLFCGILFFPFSGSATGPNNCLPDNYMQQDTTAKEKVERLDSIVVSSSRANMNTPVT
jgi:hypothetical protein